jgi:hypothetical protein
MSSVFNTVFDVSLRVLLTLEMIRGNKLTTDMLAAIDFIAVYGKDFGISDENLHGDNHFKFSEFTVRRNQVQKAVKQLVLKGFVSVAVEQGGFAYTINDRGLDYCGKLDNDYAASYRGVVKQTWARISSKSEREVLELINRQSVTSVKRGEMNG